MSNNYRAMLFYGFVIFAMFFGSGNLVLPLQIGFMSGENWVLGFVGLLLAGVLLPFLGFIVIKLYKGNYDSFFSEAGIVAKVVLPFFIISLLGSFGVTPRCIIVAHGGLMYLMPKIPLFLFSAIFSIIVFVMCLRDKIMIKILGKVLSPIKLTVLILLIAASISKLPHVDLSQTNPTESLTNGILVAYQTMDLFAAFFFSSMIFKQIQEFLPKDSSDKDTLIFSIKSGVIGFTLLALIYLGLVFLSSHYAFLLEGVSPKLMLPTIAMHTMGSNATIFIACTMFFSCLATAVALNNLYAKYLCNILKLQDNAFPVVLFFVVLLSFAMSLLDFSGITAFLVPILEISYPGLIVLTIIGIFYRKHHKAKMYIFWIITVLMILSKLSTRL